MSEIRLKMSGEEAVMAERKWDWPCFSQLLKLCSWYMDESSVPGDFPVQVQEKVTSAQYLKHFGTFLSAEQKSMGEFIAKILISLPHFYSF